MRPFGVMTLCVCAIAKGEPTLFPQRSDGVAQGERASSFAALAPPRRFLEEAFSGEPASAKPDTRCLRQRSRLRSSLREQGTCHEDGGGGRTTTPKEPHAPIAWAPHTMESTAPASWRQPQCFAGPT